MLLRDVIGTIYSEDILNMVNFTIPCSILTYSHFPIELACFRYIICDGRYLSCHTKSLMLIANACKNYVLQMMTYAQGLKFKDETHLHLFYNLIELRLVELTRVVRTFQIFIGAKFV